MKQKLIAGNWKMNGSLAANASLLQAVLDGSKGMNCQAAVCVPAAYLAQVQAILSGQSLIALGSQDVSAQEVGAYTGEISADMLKSVGVETVILGHSERRAYFHESDELINAKVKAALAHEMRVIFCFGEELKDRKAEQHFAVVESQLKAGLFNLESASWEQIILAYEPVWAIGTGLTPQPAEVEETLAWIRSYLSKSTTELFVIYGGSVNRENAASFLQLPSCHGLLIGGVSLKPLDLREIFHMATHQ